VAQVLHFDVRGRRVVFPLRYPADERHDMTRATLTAAVAALLLWACVPAPALAHCDSLDGPVVKDARLALETGDLTPALKWIAETAEAELRAVFTQVLAVRALGGEAEALADRYFFETLVRVHRQGEGAAYTGLKPAGTALDAAVAEADRALESGSLEALARLIAAGSGQGLQQRFERAVAARRLAGASTERGRAWVAAYVDFVHYAERLHGAAAGAAAHGGHAQRESEH
jgi:hypothetical protein